MTDLKYNNPESDFYGQNMMLYAPEDYIDSISGEVIVRKGDLLCSDTIRSWFPTPLYKVYILDQSAEENMGANQFNGATNGNTTSNGNLYLFRLAETYLLRAEAKFYQGRAAEAAEDVNIIVSVPMHRRCSLPLPLVTLPMNVPVNFIWRMASARADPYLVVPCPQRTTG